MNDSWDHRIDEFWNRFDDSRPDDMFAEMRELVDLRDAQDAAALYEWASIHDSLGRTGDAISIYRRAIEAGLDHERAPQAMLQLASSLRADGQAQASIAILDAWEDTGADASAVIGDAASVVRALALHDLGSDTEALRVALVGLSATLPRYRRSMTAYAEALTER